MAPKSENFQDQCDQRVFQESAYALENEPQNAELIFVPVATVINDHPNNLAINLDHSYLTNGIERFYDDNVDEIETFHDLIVPYQNRLLTIHQEESINDRSRTSELTMVMHQRALSSQIRIGNMSETVHIVNTGPLDDITNNTKDMFLFSMNDVDQDLIGLLRNSNNHEQDMTNMILLSDFIQNNLQNYEIFRNLLEYSDFPQSLQTSDIHMCDEYGHPELVGCDSFLCTSRQIFDMNYESAFVSSRDDPLSIEDFFQNLHIDSLSESLKKDHFYVLFLFYPIDSAQTAGEQEDPASKPILTSLILIEELKSFHYNVIPKFSDQSSLFNSQKYRIFCILTEINDSYPLDELILHQGLLSINETVYLKFL